MIDSVKTMQRVAELQAIRRRVHEMVAQGEVDMAEVVVLLGQADELMSAFLSDLPPSGTVQ